MLPSLCTVQYKVKSSHRDVRRFELSPGQTDCLAERLHWWSKHWKVRVKKLLLMFFWWISKENLSSGKRNSPRRYAGWNHFLTVTRPRPPFPASTQTLLSVVSTRLHVFLGVSLIPLTSALWGGVGLYDDYTKQGGERSNQWRRPETMKGGENKKMLTNNKKGE